MKMQSSKDISHVLLMDDDAVIQPHSLEVNYVFLSLLKEEYKDYVMAGSIMRIDEPNVQYELAPAGTAEISWPSVIIWI